MSKLNLDRDKVDQCRDLAKEIVGPIQASILEHSTIAVERTVLRLMGIDQAYKHPANKNLDGKESAAQGEFPLVNMLLDQIGIDRLKKGAAYWMGLAMVAHPEKSAKQVAELIVQGKINLAALTEPDYHKVDHVVRKAISPQLQQMKHKRTERERPFRRLKEKKPLIYVIVATGNIHEDVIQAKSAVKMGADIIAVIRSTAQSLLDYVPTGATTEGFGGTFATQENFKIMRKALDDLSKEAGHYIALTNYSSGLCMPEIAVMAAMEGLDYLLNDAMYGILFRDINMQRTLIDQYFSRLICSFAGITIQTGEDNYLTTAESHKYWYQVLTSHFINEEFAKKAGLPEERIALGHAFEMDPMIEDSMLFEIGQAQLVREIFPRSPIKYMPPTKHKQGDIFFSQLYDGLFNLTGIMTDQSIMLLGMPTEAIHNPFMMDRFISLKNAKYIFTGARNIASEIQFQANGKIARRARHVLDESLRLLRKIKITGLIAAIEKGVFANVSRSRDAGRGLEGVFERDPHYYNPVFEMLGEDSVRDRRERRFEQRDQRDYREPRSQGRYANRDRGNDRRSNGGRNSATKRVSNQAYRSTASRAKEGSSEQVVATETLNELEPTPVMSQENVQLAEANINVPETVAPSHHVVGIPEEMEPEYQEVTAEPVVTSQDTAPVDPAQRRGLQERRPSQQQERSRSARKPMKAVVYRPQRKQEAAAPVEDSEVVPPDAINSGEQN